MYRWRENSARSEPLRGRSTPSLDGGPDLGDGSVATGPDKQAAVGHP